MSHSFFLKDGSVLPRKDINSISTFSFFTMVLTNCHKCDNKVPKKGQCSKCGFLNGFNKLPSDDDFRAARKVNEEHGYEHFHNIDMLLLD